MREGGWREGESERVRVEEGREGGRRKEGRERDRDGGRERGRRGGREEGREEGETGIICAMFLQLLKSIASFPLKA